MGWKTIRLELARTQEFPEGSATHAYLLRLPLGSDGLIARDQLRHPDERPAVRRIWPGQNDRVGAVIPVRNGWAFSYHPGEEDDELVFHLENHPLRLGEYLTITEADGEQLPFRVVDLHD